MTKAYWIGIVDVKNHEEYKKYADIAGPALIKAGAKILSRGGRIKNLEGKKINRAVIIEFPSMEEAEKFYESKEYRNGPAPPYILFATPPTVESPNDLRP